jgi:nitroreductase
MSHGASPVISHPMSVWKKLLATAVHAPSPHNVQPWRIQILSDAPDPSALTTSLHANLLIEKGRTLPKEDTTGSFIILTMGMFIEALKILAANKDLALEFELYQSPSQFTPEHIARASEELLPFARLTLKRPQPERSPQTGQSAVHHDYAEELFFTRRTSRISLLPKAVPPDDAEGLSQLAHKWGQRYQQVTKPELIEEILAHNIDALFDDLNAPDYHDEIVGWFRFTDRASRQTRDGLDYRCMNSSRSSFWLAARLSRLLQLSLTRPLFKKTYRRQLGIVPTVGMLAGPFWEPANAFDSGRFLMHFWLEVAKRGLYLHPYGNLVTNKPAAEWCRDATSVSDIWLIFKIGFSAEPPKSYRRSVEEVLVD